MKVKKAVIPAAGFGTRMLPISKAVPKEMFPIVDKPSIAYIVEEALASGITDILIIISRGKEAIENYFDKSFELEYYLEKSQKQEILNSVKNINRGANIYFIHQQEMKGLGHAISCAESFVGNEPFAVLSGDDVIMGERPVCRQLIDAFEEYGLSVVGAQEMPKEEIGKYGSLKVRSIKDNVFMCTDMVEKPTPDKVLSLYSILGRYILTPEIFKILKNTPPGVGGEIQLTDAMKVLARSEGIIMVDFLGQRYDMGSKFGAMTACVEAALKHPEISEKFRDYVKKIANSI